MKLKSHYPYLPSFILRKVEAKWISAIYPNDSLIMVSFNKHWFFLFELGMTYAHDLKYNFKNINIKLK